VSGSFETLGDAFFELFLSTPASTLCTGAKKSEQEQTARDQNMASFREILRQDRTEAIEIDRKKDEGPLYDMYFETLRIARIPTPHMTEPFHYPKCTRTSVIVHKIEK
jgi:hypothetical protein